MKPRKINLAKIPKKGKAKTDVDTIEVRDGHLVTARVFWLKYFDLLQVEIFDNGLCKLKVPVNDRFDTLISPTWTQPFDDLTLGIVAKDALKNYVESLRLSGYEKVEYTEAAVECWSDEENKQKYRTPWRQLRLTAKIWLGPQRSLFDP